MGLTPWKKLSEKIEAKNFKWEYRIAKYLAPNGEEWDYHYRHGVGGGAVLMVAVDSEGRIPWVREFRPLFDSEDEGFPVGAIDKGESKETSVEREFAEEAKMKASNVELVGSFAPDIANSDSKIFVYVGYGLEPAEAKIDDVEEFEREMLTAEEVEQRIRSGKVISGSPMAAWSLAKPRILEIIDEQKRNM